MQSAFARGVNQGCVDPDSAVQPRILLSPAHTQIPRHARKHKQTDDTSNDHANNKRHNHARSRTHPYCTQIQYSLSFQDCNGSTSHKACEVNVGWDNNTWS